ncbi:UNVERIFIED_CONTAM: hypothetical protein Slati_1052200 [Sesamum latifolium]|uniref:Uncharacterized protein n=1 Tax=Sesamum latifolium TaxID=2727402 RepID=A0AAW2XU79_9LAMI
MPLQVQIKLQVFKSTVTPTAPSLSPMATHFNPTYTHSKPRAVVLPLHHRKISDVFFFFTPCGSKQLLRNCDRTISISRIRATGWEGDSYLDMWRKAVERERKSADFEKMAENSAQDNEEGKEESDEEFDRKNTIAAARALLHEASSEARVEKVEDPEGGTQSHSLFLPQSGNSDTGTPGPSFWAWTPPPSDDDDIFAEIEIKPASPSPTRSIPVLELERGLESLTIPFQSSMLQNSLPPFQSVVEVEKETPHLKEEHEIEVQFSEHADEAVDALSKVDEASSQGVNPDGSRWWKEIGVERRPDGVLCKWVLTRGVSADKTIEWENKYWEAADEFGYKELGSEKSGRDAVGNVWREFWRESMMQHEGLMHFEKTADKWGKNIQGDEWHEKWWEHYDASGRAEKWAHKWCSIDPNSPVEDGHAHMGEKYDGQGGSTKYTDKWAERFEGDGWAKWGDKWDEHFDPNGHGVKQGETWWEGKHGDRWNRTWGEGHNGTGWVHKYGKSSSGEHWDSHVQEETWYERFPHFGFFHCFENSVQLRLVRKPSEWS